MDKLELKEWLLKNCENPKINLYIIYYYTLTTIAIFILPVIPQLYSAILIQFDPSFLLKFLNFRKINKNPLRCRAKDFF